jgi:hypothetical protein
MSLNAFPAVSQSFINSFTGTRKFVDITNGSNTNNGDTEATAYQTLAYAQSQTSAINTAVMYVINPGTYNLTAVEVSGFASAGFSDSNLPRTFFCAPNGQTVFQWTAGSQRDAAMVSLQNNGSAVYGAVLKRNNNGRSQNYEVAMFNNSTAHCQGDFYNCVFQETNANGNWSLQYDNSASAQSTVNHCTFYTIENGASDYTGGAGLVFNNCAFNYNYGAGSATKNNTVVNQTIDAEDYELATDNTTYGVYSGTYAWGPLGPIVEYLVVAGGGSGGHAHGGGGGGGGSRTGSLGIQTDTNYTVTVGAGAAGKATRGRGNNGSNSIFGSISATGGGGGGSQDQASEGISGGSGGGGGNATSGSKAGGAGNAGGYSPVEGYAGGSAAAGSAWVSAGGGGAGGIGAPASGSTPGAGGIGVISSITGSSVYYAGGGGGCGENSGTGGAGGAGGGTAGSGGTDGSSSAAANTGGGSGGTRDQPGTGLTPSGSGGSGVVILKYPDTLTIINADGGLAFTTSTAVSGYKITTFTEGTGSIQLVVPEDGLYSSHPTEAYWGESVTFQYFDADQANGATIPYSITGVTSAQISNADLTGNFTFNGGAAAVTVVLTTQSSLAIATMVFSSGGNTFSIDISNILSFVSSVPGTFWGGTIIFTVQTKGLVSNGTVSYSISGVTSAQISNASLTADATYVPGSGLDGTATFTVVTNSAEPVLNSATMVTGITGASLTNVIRTGSPRLSESYKSSVSSLVFIDTEVTDVHFEDLEARVNAVTNINSQLAVSQLKLSPSTVLFIDTEVTDVHAPGLEATVFALDDINSPLVVSKFNSGLDGFVAAPTFAYSSGEDVKVSATASQTWYI